MKKTPIFAAIALSLAGNAYASETPSSPCASADAPSPYQYSITAAPWAAETNFKYSFDSSGADAKYGTPTSELNFKGMKSSGVAITLDGSNGNGYRTLTLSLGKGSGSNGTMVDDDYYSEGYVGTGNPTRFSSTLSDSRMSNSFMLSYGYGSVFSFENPIISEVRLGYGISVAQHTFEAKGLEVLEDPYNMYGSKKELFGKDVQIIKMKNQQLLNSLDLGLKKTFSNGIALNAKTNAIFLGLMRTEDDHLKRQDLGSPSFVLTSAVYGLKTDLSASYSVDKLTFTAGANYMFLTPYDFNSNAEVFDKNDKSIGGVPIVSHEFKQFGYYAGATYHF